MACPSSIRVGVRQGSFWLEFCQPRTGENVARAQPSHEEDEIQNSNFEHVPRKCPSDDPEEDDRKPAAKKLKWSQKMMLRV